MAFNRALGIKIVESIEESGNDIRVGDESYETLTEMNNGVDVELAAIIRESSIQFWGSVAAVLTNGDKEEYRELKVYDGTPKRSKPVQNHLDHFIPEDRFHTPSSPPATDFTDFERNKEDVSLVPVFTPPSTLTSIRNGYRVIIRDNIIKSTSIIIYTIVALDRTEENDIPESYDHVSPGSNYIINQKDEEFQLFFEEKGAYSIKYGVWNGDINENSEPIPIPLEQ